MKPFFLIITLFFILINNTEAQNFKITKFKYKGLEEPCIGVNKKHPNNIIIGTNINTLLVSQDFGKTWENVFMTSRYGVWGDPVVISDSSGIWYYFHLSKPYESFPNDKDPFLDRIVCQTSNDNGLTWSRGTFMGLNPPKDQDKEWAIHDPLSNTIYVSWTQFDKYESEDPIDKSTIMFSASRDSGKTWTKAIDIATNKGTCLDNSSTTEGAVPAVGPKGQLYITWSLNDSIYLNKSYDGGKTWLNKEVAIIGGTKGWDFKVPGIYRTNGLPILKVGSDGRLYLNWSDQRNGSNNTDIWLSYSDDEGDTWADPIRVNQDTTQSHQFFTWMEYDSEKLYFIYHDRRADRNNKLKTDVYLAISTDKGKSFKEYKVTKKPFKAKQHIFFGDYNNITVNNGIIYPVWTEIKGTSTIVAMAKIEEKKLND